MRHTGDKNLEVVDLSRKKRVYYFGPAGAEGSSSQKNLLGGKGANLAEMCNLKIPVPPGFTISTSACVDFFAGGNVWPDGLINEITKSVKRIEIETGKGFGDKENPLLLSVRSGARASMPGMMDTILNLGLNDETVEGLGKISGNERFAWDSYRRFLAMFADVALDINRSQFESALGRLKEKLGVKSDTDVPVESLRELALEYKSIIEGAFDEGFPQDPKTQLSMAIGAVFRSWHNDRAKEYRRMYKIPESWGTAVNIQSMVFGNLGETSGTGVAFTRNPSTGERLFFGEYLFNAQGEDVVAGVRTPLSIDQMGARTPSAHKELIRIYQRLEKHYRDMLDIEFTVENGVLFMLQCRVGKRTAQAAVRIAVEMAGERLISKSEAVNRIHADQLDQLLHDTIDPSAGLSPVAHGLAASPGAGVGRVVFTAEDAVTWKKNNEKTILVRRETSPEDIAGMNAAEGILTATGGMTSHAAVVARGMGRCCVAGAEELNINEVEKFFAVNGHTVKEGDYITIDGTGGNVYLGQAPLVKPELSGEYDTLMSWADKFRKLKVRANADTPKDAKIARKFGAEGIGLCRTEHMFFEGDRIIAVREMILADTLEERKEALAKLLPMQKSDFKGIFDVMEGTPVTIRLLDPPLHEFLPKTESDFEKVALDLGVDISILKSRSDSHHEFNPMLGHRGCRLGITYPEIYEMQVRAIMTAVCELKKKGKKVKPEIMIPLISHVEELTKLRKLVQNVVDEVLGEFGLKMNVMIGTMIELPRAAITAKRIAEEADFFSFGTNDLTQTTFGLSRDDSGRFLPHYVADGILASDPFVALDRDGVGELIKIGVAGGRATKPKLEIGICGEHGGEPSSVEFCHQNGFDYVSCSPFRTPIARLAAAQSAIMEKENTLSDMPPGKTGKKIVVKSKPSKKAASRWSAKKKALVKKETEKAEKEKAERRAKKKATKSPGGKTPKR